MIARPICAVCRKPVEIFEEGRDAWDGLVMTARCHGDSETFTITAADLEAVKSIDLGEAFASSARRLGP